MSFCIVALYWNAGELGLGAVFPTVVWILLINRFIGVFLLGGLGSMIDEMVYLSFLCIGLGNKSLWGDMKL